MGKASRAKKAPKQPKIQHFIMSGDAYLAIRRYLGSKPHDECRELIIHMEQMPAVTDDDMALRAKQAERLAHLEDKAAEFIHGEERRAANGADQGKIIYNPEDLPNEEIEELGLMIAPDPDNPGQDPDMDLVAEVRAMEKVIDEENDPNVANDNEEEQ